MKLNIILILELCFNDGGQNENSRSEKNDKKIIAKNSSNK